MRELADLIEYIQRAYKYGKIEDKAVWQNEF